MRFSEFVPQGNLSTRVTSSAGGTRIYSSNGFGFSRPKNSFITVFVSIKCDFLSLILKVISRPVWHRLPRRTDYFFEPWIRLQQVQEPLCHRFEVNSKRFLQFHPENDVSRRVSCFIVASRVFFHLRFVFRSSKNLSTTSLEPIPCDFFNSFQKVISLPGWPPSQAEVRFILPTDYNSPGPRTFHCRFGLDSMWFSEFLPEGDLSTRVTSSFGASRIYWSSN